MGAHRVVSTKLPSVGHTREAIIAAGNTTTRLLGKSLIMHNRKEVFQNLVFYIL
jgi:hypothetical protein